MDARSLLSPHHLPFIFSTALWASLRLSNLMNANVSFLRHLAFLDTYTSLTTPYLQNSLNNSPFKELWSLTTLSNVRVVHPTKELAKSLQDVKVNDNCDLTISYRSN
ncbi:hypothetical protein PIB30_032250 [Stylosanthes scabra]|uniref:Uncharacterized protein n=1 Tax=Stylosanthes scabra TaxID=79078 RepID=A0ABU6VBA9_9FABA|nr:hypothetical protein [Stylosanthes scabra]